MSRRVMVAFKDLLHEWREINSVFQVRYDNLSLVRQYVCDFIKSQHLEGVAYSSSKEYFENIYLPIFIQLEDCCREFQDCALTVSAEYVNRFGVVSELPTDTLELEGMISSLRTRLSEVKASRDEIQSSQTNVVGAVIQWGIVEAYDFEISAIENRISKIQDFIDKLIDYNSIAERIFSKSASQIESLRNTLVKLKENVIANTQYDSFDNARWSWRNADVNDCIREYEKNKLWYANGKINKATYAEIFKKNGRLNERELLELYKYYGNVPLDSTYEEFMLYLAVNDPATLNECFSDLIDDEDGSYKFHIIRKWLKKDKGELTEAQYAMLIAAFNEMGDDEKEQFLEVAYTEKGFVEGCDFKIDLTLGEAFIEMKDIYANALEVNGEVLANKVNLNDFDMVEAYNNYNLMSLFSSEDFRNISFYNPLGSLLDTPEISIDISSLSDVDGFYDKKVVISSEKGIKDFVYSAVPAMRTSITAYVFSYRENVSNASSLRSAELCDKFEEVGTIKIVGYDTGIEADGSLCQLTETAEKIALKKFYSLAQSKSKYYFDAQTLINREIDYSEASCTRILKDYQSLGIEGQGYIVCDNMGYHLTLSSYYVNEEKQSEYLDAYMSRPDVNGEVDFSDENALNDYFDWAEKQI